VEKDAITMGYSHQVSTLGIAVLLALSGSVQAGDYYPPGQVVEAPEGSVVEFGTGWYLRGDMAVSTHEVDPTFTLGGVKNNQDVGYLSSFGVGGGYRINNFLRVDGTIDQFMNFGYDSQRSVNCGSWTWDHDANPATAERPMTGACDESRSLSASATVLMLNGYLDLGNYSGFTPYVGGGIGAAYVRWDDYNQTDTCHMSVATATTCLNGTVSTIYSPTTFSSNKEWKPAASLMAGVSYDISQNLKLDVGYKYTYISGGNATDNVNMWPGFASVKYDAFNIHQVRIGLRYEIW